MSLQLYVDEPEGSFAMSALLAMVVGLLATGIVLAGLSDATAAESLAGLTSEPP
jgi:hypothetical protein